MKVTAGKKTIFWKPYRPWWKRRLFLSILALVVILALAGTAIGIHRDQRSDPPLGKQASSHQLTAAASKEDAKTKTGGDGSPKSSGAKTDPAPSSSQKENQQALDQNPEISGSALSSVQALSSSLSGISAGVTPPAIAPQTAGGSTVPEHKPVSDDYFDDAVFVGDSRTQGLMLYSGLDHATFYANKGLNVNEVFDKKLAAVNGRRVSIATALSETSYSKVYIMLGINELGWVYPEKFSSQYAKLIDVIQSAHPDAVIYLEGLLPVTADKSAGDPITNNINIDRFNVIIEKLAKEKKVNYLNVREAVQDQNGNLCSDATTDGVHLNKTYCLKWLDYLKTHTI